VLVLTRRVGEQIVLADGGIRIVVQAVNGKRVRLGVEAPPDIRIYRGEIWQRMIACKEGQEDAQVGGQTDHWYSSPSAAAS
jgi:carbon storage regulator